MSLHVAPDGGSVDTAYSLEVVGAPQAIAPSEAGESRAGSLPAYGGVAYALDVALPHWRSTLLPADERPPAVPPAAAPCGSGRLLMGRLAVSSKVGSASGCTPRWRRRCMWLP